MGTLEFVIGLEMVLFGPDKYDAIYNRISCLISQKSGVTYIVSHNYAKIRIDLYDIEHWLCIML